MHPSGSNTAPTDNPAAGSAQIVHQTPVPAQITNQSISQPASAATGSQAAAETSAESSQSNPDATPQAPGPPAQVPRTPAQYYAMVANRLYHAISKDWVPHVMTPEVVAEHLYATQRRIERIHVLEAEQAAKLPAIDPRIEQALFVARVDYRTRFPRTFRINDLPTEILSNILRLICWSAPDPQTSTRSRLYLTWVCRQWRAVMIEDHTLWNAIWFSDYPNYERSLTWFDRSGHSAIDVRINDSKEKPWTLDIARKVIDKLFTKLENIRVMVVVLQEWDPILHLLRSLDRVKADNLSIIMERLELHRTGPAFIQAGDNHEPVYYRRLVQLFGGAYVPSFNHLTANGVHLDWSGTILRNMRTLDLRRMPLNRVPSLNEFRLILRNSPTLRKLVLDGAGPKWPLGPVNTRPVPMPTLSSIAMGDFSPAYGAYAAAQFTCPNALDFTLMNMLREDFAPFFQLMTERTPLLRVLTLYGAELGSATPAARVAFVKYLEAMPQLAFLRINGVAPGLLDLFLWDSERMQSAAGASEPPEHPVCPALAVLEYHTMDTEYIASWVTARREMGLPLRKVYIGEQTVRDVSVADRQKLITAMGTFGVSQILNPILRPKEELELLSEDY